MIVEEIDGRIMARVEEDSHIFEVNFNELEVKDVVLAFYNDGVRVGSIYNDDGTQRVMARLETVGDEDFISVELEKKFVSEILDKASEKDFIEIESSKLKSYKKRMKLD